MNAFNPAHFRTRSPTPADAGVYLDSVATASKPQAVIDTNGQSYRLSAGNIHRSQFTAAQWLTERYEAVREHVTAWLNAPSSKDIVWTRGTTEAINVMTRNYARPQLQSGDEIIVSEAEHHANPVLWLMTAGQIGARVVRLPLGADRPSDVASLNVLIIPRSRVLTIGQMSNVTDGCPDLAQTIRLTHTAGVVVMVDGTQDAVYFPVDMQVLDIDFYVFSGCKLYGPTGIGALYDKSELLAAMSPWLGGGKMIAEVSSDDFTPQPTPYGLEAGTPNIVGAIGLNAALEWPAQSDINQAEDWSRSLASLAEEALTKQSGSRSSRYQQSNLLTFEFDSVYHSDLVTLLTESDIALHAGQHCVQPLLAALGVSGTSRTLFAPHNT